MQKQKCLVEKKFNLCRMNAMNIKDLDLYFRELLHLEDFEEVDASQNGLQVSCSLKPIKKIAFAVDACLENFQKTVQVGADLLFVHHGLFWGKSLTVTGVHYSRLETLIKNDIALYAVHLPLDVHAIYGNNAVMAANLNLQNIERFGLYKNMKLGFKGEIYSSSKNENGVDYEELISRLFKKGEKPKTVLPFGKKQIKTVGLISGSDSASSNLNQAISEGLDCFITGEIKHEIYHVALENKINVIAGGHYQTETFGVKAVGEKLNADTKIETVFLDTPTNL